MMFVRFLISMLVILGIVLGTLCSLILVKTFKVSKKFPGIEKPIPRSRIMKNNIRLVKDPLTERVYVYNGLNIVAAINREILKKFLDSEDDSIDVKVK